MSASGTAEAKWSRRSSSAPAPCRPSLSCSAGTGRSLQFTAASWTFGWYHQRSRPPYIVHCLSWFKQFAHSSWSSSQHFRACCYRTATAPYTNESTAMPYWRHPYCRYKLLLQNFCRTGWWVTSSSGRGLKSRAWPNTAELTISLTRSHWIQACRLQTSDWTTLFFLITPAPVLPMYHNAMVLDSPFCRALCHLSELCMTQGQLRSNNSMRTSYFPSRRTTWRRWWLPKHYWEDSEWMLRAGRYLSVPFHHHVSL